VHPAQPTLLFLFLLLQHRFVDINNKSKRFIQQQLPFANVSETICFAFWAKTKQNSEEDGSVSDDAGEGGAGGGRGGQSRRSVDHSRRPHHVPPTIYLFRLNSVLLYK
jgi:hypothetical protein